MLRDKKDILARWVRWYSRMLLDDLKPEVIDSLIQRPVATARGGEPMITEVETAVRSLADGKATGPDDTPIKLLKLGLHLEPVIQTNLHYCADLVRGAGAAGGMERCATLKMLRKKKEKTGSSNYRGIALVAHAGKAFL